MIDIFKKKETGRTGDAASGFTTASPDDRAADQARIAEATRMAAAGSFGCRRTPADPTFYPGMPG